MPHNDPNAVGAMLNNQQRQLDSIELQIQKLTEVMTRMALLEERRAQDRQSIEKLDQRVTEDRKAFDVFRDEQRVKNTEYSEMGEAYKKLKSIIFTAVGGGMVAAALAFSSGLVKIGH